MIIGFAEVIISESISNNIEIEVFIEIFLLPLFLQRAPLILTISTLISLFSSIRLKRKNMVLFLTSLSILTISLFLIFFLIPANKFQFSNENIAQLNNYSPNYNYALLENINRKPEVIKPLTQFNQKTNTLFLKYKELSWHFLLFYSFSFSLLSLSFWKLSKSSNLLFIDFFLLFIFYFFFLYSNIHLAIHIKPLFTKFIFFETNENIVHPLILIILSTIILVLTIPINGEKKQSER